MIIVIKKGYVKKDFKSIIKDFEKEISKVLQGYSWEQVDANLLDDIRQDLYDVIDDKFKDDLKSTKLDVTFSTKSKVFMISVKNSFIEYKTILSPEP